MNKEKSTAFEPIYMHAFKNNASIIEAFGLVEEALDDCHVLLACYSGSGYDGNAFVLFESYGKLEEVNGSHCSCYGLEDQWNPEETTVKALEHRLVHGSLGNVGGYDDERYEKELRMVVEYLKGKLANLSEVQRRFVRE